MNHTPEQIEDWKRYEKVRQAGRWNMFDPSARFATGLSKDEYMYVMKNFSELRALAEGAK